MLKLNKEIKGLLYLSLQAHNVYGIIYTKKDWRYREMIGKNSQKKKISKMKLRKEIDSWVLMLPMVIVLYLIVWRPTVMSMIWSFFKMKAYTPQNFVGLDNYVNVLSHTLFVPTLINTVWYVIWSLVIGFLPPLIIAIALNEMIRFKNFFRIVAYIPAVIPGIAAMLIWKYIYYPDQTGLLNMCLGKLGLESFGWLQNPHFTIIGIVVYKTWKGFAGAVLLYYAALQGTSTELYEAAVIDGAGPWKRAWHVTRPSIEGLLLLNLVRQIISVFQTMDEPLAMTGGGPNNASNTLSFQLYQYGFNSGGNATGQAMALGVIIFLILIVFTCFYFILNKKIENRYN